MPHAMFKSSQSRTVTLQDATAMALLDNLEQLPAGKSEISIDFYLF